MDLRVVFIASLCTVRSFDSFTMQCILVSETPAIRETKSQVDQSRDGQDYPVTKNADGQTDRQTDGFSALYSRLANGYLPYRAGVAKLIAILLITLPIIIHYLPSSLSCSLH